jgi:AcrR family transcriptional regulator
MLSTESVIGAGVLAVRESGLEQLGIRSLAERLQVTPMALYRHVGTAQALEEAVVDAVLAEVPPVACSGSWAERARGFVTRARPVLCAHPGVARHVLTNWFRLPRVLDWLEVLLGAAQSHGMDGTRAVAAVNAVFMYLLMRVEAEVTVRQARAVRRRLPRGKRAARWPLLIANAGEYEEARFDVHFAYGLEVLLAGMEACR